MFTKNNRWIFALTATGLVLLFVMLSLPAQVSAAQKSELVPNSCFTCHEDLYYLQDMGKYYCIAEHKDRCINCHEGNAAVMVKEEAHVALIAYPQKDNGAKCQECHEQDSEARLAKFSSLGGFNEVLEASAYIPSQEIRSGFPEMTEINPLLEKWPWLAGALVLFSLWLVLVFISPQKP